MKKLKPFSLLIIVLMMFIISGCKSNNKEEENNNTNKDNQINNVDKANFLPEELDQILCSGLHDAVLQSVVTDKELIDEFIKMINKCVFHESNKNDIFNEEDNLSLGIYEITIGDLKFWLLGNGAYHEPGTDIYYILENFDSKVFEKFVNARHPL